MINFWDKLFLELFSPNCVICEKTAKKYLCQTCKHKLQMSNLYLNKIESYFQDSAKFFDYHYYLFSYNSIIREKIIQYKFYNKPYLVYMFCEFFEKNHKLCRFLKNYCDIIIPVPITNKKIVRRGYNQSELLASNISKNTSVVFKKNILVKCKENKIQSTLNKKQRLDNVKGVYKIQNEQKIINKKVLLVDDIYTTGATVNECAKILKQAGVNMVSIFSIAKDF